MLCPAPGCGRSLQTLELQGVLAAPAFAGLLARLREAEEAAPDDDPGAVLGLELRLCPKCKVGLFLNCKCCEI